jgi:hypothetical protein
MEFFVLFRMNVSEPVLRPSVTHCRSSASSIVFRLPLSDIPRAYLREKPTAPPIDVILIGSERQIIEYSFERPEGIK